MKKKLGVSSFFLIIEKFFNVERFFIFQRACLSSQCSRIQNCESVEAFMGHKLSYSR